MVNSGSVSELKVTTVMALHYFAPLLPKSGYLIDGSYNQRKKQRIEKCETCQANITYGDTSIGTV